MPRPSLKTVRSKEILDAFVACAARYGLEGATQERIAEAAGVKRTILRHYLGNRDAMIDALIDHVVAEFDAQTEALLAALPETDRVGAILDLLFGAGAATDPDMVLAFQALVASSDRLPKARTALLSCTARFVAMVEDELRDEYPAASGEQVSAAALGIVALCFNVDALAPLRPPTAWLASSRRAAGILVSALKDNDHD